MFAASIRRVAVQRLTTPLSPSSTRALSCIRTGIRHRPEPSSSSHYFNGNINTATSIFRLRRKFSVMADSELNKRLGTFQDLFVEARLCIDDVVDSAETTYFDEDAEAATEAVKLAVDEFEAIIKDVEDVDQKNRILRGNGLKVEQLKGELKMAIQGGH
mmetsp:Transcript_8602/g.19335  ORF Transcript_8602/g.19335 Transcript_8602/m.19335 type:complete len:159 (-) Transcript_8602:308-784(-)